MRIWRAKGTPHESARSSPPSTLPRGPPSAFLLCRRRRKHRDCPDAWGFNYINPSPVIGAALWRYTDLKVLALCDGVLLPDKKLELMRRTGVAETAADEVRDGHGTS